MNFFVYNALSLDILYKGNDVDEANEIIGAIGLSLPMYLIVKDKKGEIKFEQLLCKDKTKLN